MLTTIEVASIVHRALRVADNEGQIPLQFDTLSREPDRLDPASNEGVESNTLTLHTSGGQSFRITVQEESTMDLSRAIDLVTQDQRESSPDMSRAEAVKHARDVISLPGKFTPGTVELDDQGDELSQAYRVVLSASDGEISAA